LLVALRIMFSIAPMVVCVSFASLATLAIGPGGELKTVYVKLASGKNQYSAFYAGHFSKCLL